MLEHRLKKHFIKVLALLVMLGGSIQLPVFQQNAYAQSNENLLANPGFESNFTGWSVNASNSTAVIDSTIAHSGSKSMKITADVNKTFNVVTSLTYIQVYGEQPIRLDLFSKTSMTRGDISIGIRYSDTLGTAYYDWYPLQMSNDWIKQGVTLTVPENRNKVLPADYKWQAQVYIMMAAEAVGTAWIDDIVLYTGNMAGNPGFETSGSDWSGNITYDTSNKMLGNQSAKLTGSSGGLSQFYSSTSIAAYEFQEISLIAHYKGNNTNSQYFYMGFGFFDRSGKLISEAMCKTNRSAAWTQQKYTAKAPEGTSSFKVYFRFNCTDASKAINIDEIFCYTDNLLLNPGYENGAGSWNVRAAIVDSGTSHSGTSSIRIAGDSTNPWNVFEIWYPVSAKAGANYMVQSFTKSSLTAGVFKMGLRFLDSNRNTIAYGWYDVPNTASWNKNEAVFITPEGTVYVQPYYWLSQDAVGQVWADDTLLKNVPEALTFTLSDNRVWTSETEIMAKFNINLATGNLSDYKVKLERYNYGEAAPVFTKEYTSLQSNFADYFNVSDLPMGYSVYNASLIKISDSSVLLTKTQECQKIEKYVYAALPDTASVTIGTNNNILLNGGNFLTRSMYHADPYDYEIMKDRGFNVVQARPDKLDEVYHAGLKAMCALYISPSIIDYDYINTMVEQYKNHPALLLWLINDEPDLNGLSGNDMQTIYNSIRAIDANHPITFVRAHKYAVMDSSYDSALDISTSDPYPIAEYSEQEAFNVIKDRADYMAAKSKPVNLVLQSFGGYSTYDIPTDEQVRVMAYLGLNHGVKAFSFYCNDDYGSGWLLRRNGQDIWSMYKVLNQELETLKDVIAAPEIMQDISSSSADIDIKVRMYNGVKYLFAVNKTGKELNVTFSGAGLTDKASAQPVYEYRSVDVSSNTFTDLFTPYMVHIYKLQP